MLPTGRSDRNRRSRRRRQKAQAPRPRSRSRPATRDDLPAFRVHSCAVALNDFDRGGLAYLNRRPTGREQNAAPTDSPAAKGLEIDARGAELRTRLTRDDNGEILAITPSKIDISAATGVNNTGKQAIDHGATAE